MLKNKSLKDFNFISEKELFTELTPEEGATISGGYDYIFDNRSSATFKPQFNGWNYEVAPLSKLTVFSDFPEAGILYDKKIGPGYELTALVIRPGTTSIDQTPDGRFLVFPPQVVGSGGTAPAAAAAAIVAAPAATAAALTLEG